MGEGAGTGPAGSALPPSQLPLDLGDTAGAGVGVPARWAAELAELAALVAADAGPRPGRTGAAEGGAATGLTGAGEATGAHGATGVGGAAAGAGPLGNDESAPPAGTSTGGPAGGVGAAQVAAFEDLHSRLRQVLGALDAG